MRSMPKGRKTLLETPTFKQPLLEASRPVLLPTPDEPPLPAEPASKSYKKGRPSSRKRYDSQQDDDGYSYQDEDYPKKRKSKSSIYKKYQKGNKYSDYRYDREHKDNYQRGPGLWGSPEDKRSDRAVASDVHYSNYAWPSTSQQHHQEYGQQGYRPATDQQQHGGYDYSSWASQQQQQAPAPPVPPSPIPPPAPAPVYSGYEQSSYQATSQWSHHQQPAPAAAGSEYQYQQQTGYHQSTYGEAAAGYQTWSTGEQTTQQHQGYAQPPAAQGAPGGPPYSTEQLIHLAKQFPELASSNILAQVTREQHSSKKSKQESSSRGKSKKKGEGYERLAAAYERLASVLEKAFKEDAPKPPMPPRAATPGHRSPERRSQSPRRFTASPRRPPTPTQDEMDHSRRTVLFPTREYKLF
ncbi:uncharacterized protein [Amphiura filiformis]|uniref:uncharacterized protein isoform X2 n=1 Tax=Amphiura filiformis TaxID=82378 RepID=UPI003B20F951